MVAFFALYFTTLLSVRLYLVDGRFTKHQADRRDSSILGQLLETLRLAMGTVKLMEVHQEDPQVENEEEDNDSEDSARVADRRCRRL